MSKKGKNAIYVNSNIYAENVQKDNFTKDSVASQIPDKVRYYSSNFWTSNKNKLIKCDADPVFKVAYLDETIINLEADKTKFYEDTFENGLLKKQFNSQAWQSFIEQILPSDTQIFEDYYTIFPEPINLAEEPDTVEKNISFINKEFIFNFLSQKFEKLTGEQLFDVNTLPTIYNILNDKKVDVKTEEENLILSLGGLVPSNYVDSLITSNKPNTLLEEYFNEYSDVYVTQEATPVIAKISDNNKNTLYTKEKLELIKKLNNKFVPFPFYTKTEFSNISPEADSFCQTLNNIGDLDEELFYFINNQYTVKERNFIYNTSDQKSIEVSLPEHDIKKWVSTKLPNYSSAGFQNFENAPGNDTLSASSVVKYTELLKYIKNKLSIKARKYENLLSSCYLDVAFYKIEKRQFNYNKKNSPVSTYYVAPDTSEIIKFIDTQVKYGLDYYYTITAYTLVVGTEYKYKNYYPDTVSLEKNRDLAEGKYKLKVESKPVYKIFEIPMAKFTGAIHESPHTKPVIKLQQQDDKIIFNILQSDLKNREKFEIIENNDFKIFENIRLSQDNENPETIESKINEKPDIKLQIYRTTNYPVNYLSFQGKLYKTLILEKNDKSFMDTLLPNTKYYYTFRYLNEHDIPSNASIIYEVKLINEDGYYYLETSLLDFKQPIEKKLSKGMKKYLLIRPSVLQTQPRYSEEAKTVNDINLGPIGENVWDKQFVLSIKSNKSNRKLKFYFKAKINK